MGNPYGRTAAPSSRPSTVAKPHADRAKQFMPFAALKGYYELVRQQERKPEPRHEATEEDQIRISAALASLRKGDMAKVTYYDVDAYVELQGMVSEIVPEYQVIRIVKTKVRFEDILDIAKL